MGLGNTNQGFSGGGGGSTSCINSVGLTMPSAFNVCNSPLTCSGTINVCGAGATSQYIRGDGTLADFPSVGGGSSVNYYLNGSVNQGTFGGDVYYQMSKTALTGAGVDFTRTNAQGNGYIASFITDVGDPSFLNIPSGNWNLEFYFNSSSSGGNPSFYGELYKVSASNVFTLIASNSVSPEGITGGTSVDQYYTSISVPQTTLLITDRLAIRIYVTTSNRNITFHTENNTLSEVLTTFTTGITALNGLTEQVQLFSVGTCGTDFNIDSCCATHTFNLPTASCSARGALSAADYCSFSQKVMVVGCQSGSTVRECNNNVACGSFSTISGGVYNTNGSNSCYSVIGGGSNNCIFGRNSSILGGDSNIIYFTSSYSSVSGGYGNNMIAAYTGASGCQLFACCPCTFYANNFCACGSVYSSALSCGCAVCANANGQLVGYTPTVSTAPIIVLGSGCCSTLRCGVGNCASDCYSFAGGGSVNCAAGAYSFVGGGCNNKALSYFTFVGSGNGNVASATNSFVGGGYNNTVYGTESFIGGGFSNTVSAAYSFVGGGRGNVASATNSFVVGGYNNSALSCFTFIGGGIGNAASGCCSFIGSGYGNFACGVGSFVGGGVCNTALASFSGAVGCCLNACVAATFYSNNFCACGSVYSSALSCGCAVCANANGQLVGYTPTVSTAPIIVLGSGCCSTLRCGVGNCASGCYSFAGGGCCNIVSGAFSGAVGCNLNACNACTFYSNNFCACGSFYSSALTSGRAVCVSTNGQLVGYIPTVATAPVMVLGTGVCSTVRCGVGNCASGGNSFVVGFSNTASGYYSSVGGGTFNTVTSVFSNISGGYTNNVCSSSSSIVGGNYNNILCNSPYSIISGGAGNTVTSCYGFIGGGTFNTVSAAYSGATGFCLNACNAFTFYTNNFCACGSLYSSALTSTCAVCVSTNGQLVGYTPSSGGITGSGTCNFVPKFTGSTTLGNSLVYDNGTSVGINTTTPSASYKLDVNGASNFYSSTVGATVLTVQGSTGQLFTVSDVTTGNVFQVNDVSGLPLFAVNANGSYYSYTKSLTAIAATTVAYSVDKTTGTAAYFDYRLTNTTNSGWRAGTVMVVWDGTNVEFTDTSTNDITATTSGLSWTAAISGSNLNLTATITSGTWNIKIGSRVI
jgi:hypothetical protein